MQTKAEVKGRKGEIETIRILRYLGYEVRRPDLMFFDGENWYNIEVKNKEPFEPPPDYMQGIPRKQWFDDMRIYKKTGLRTILVVKGKEGQWLGQYLDKLEPNYSSQQLRLKCGDLLFFKLTQFKLLFTLLTNKEENCSQKQP